MRDRIFKLSPIHASVIISFPEFAEFSESSPFRKNSIDRADCCLKVHNVHLHRLFRDMHFYVL